MLNQLIRVEKRRGKAGNRKETDCFTRGRKERARRAQAKET